MKKRNLLIVILIITLLLGACKAKTNGDTTPDPVNPDATQAPVEASKVPTHTPRYLGPIYQTKIFLGGTVGRITLIKLLFTTPELWRALGHRYATRFSQANARLSLDFKLFLQWKYGLYPAQPPRRQEFALQNRQRWRNLGNDRTGLSRRANVFHQ